MRRHESRDSWIVDRGSNHESRFTIHDSRIRREQHLQLYYWLKLNRAVDDQLALLYRQGKVIGGCYSSRGQEAISCGSAFALEKEDYLGPMIRNVGAVLVKGFRPRDVLTQYMGKATSPTGGKDGSSHFGDLQTHGVVAPISHLGSLIPVMAGIGLAARMQGRRSVALTYIGDGGASVGEVHEGLNFAAVRRCPLVLILENNGWAYSTPVEQQTLVRDFAERARGYGIPGVIVDGNDVLAVYRVTREAVDRARAGQGPTLIEAKTFRMKGHAEHDSASYVPRRMFEEWSKKDPITRFEKVLQKKGWLDKKTQAEVEARVQQEIRSDLEWAEASPMPEGEKAREGVFCEGGIKNHAEFGIRNAESKAIPNIPHSAFRNPHSGVTYLEAIRQGLWEEMERDPAVFVMGEDVGRYGGAFQATAGLLEHFGEQRVLDTPLAEAALVGAAAGAALVGMRPVVELQFMDFISNCFNQVVNMVAKIHYRWGASVPLVIRGPSGGGVHGGPFHSQNPEMWFVHTPGLKIVCPAGAADAKGLLKAAIRDNNPVLFFEHKFLYRRIKEEMPAGDHVVPLGKALVRRPGRDISVITYGAMVWVALDAARELEKEGVDLEVLDLRTLVPLDRESVLDSVRRTNKVILLHEDNRTGGMGAELAAILAEEAFEDLDGPVVRVTALDTPMPFSPPLEEVFLPQVADVKEAARKLAAY